MGKKSQSLSHEARKIKIQDLVRERIIPLCEVAKLVGISKTAIYSYLKEISNEWNVPYESLLDQPHHGYNREAPYISHKNTKADAQVPSEESISDSPFEELLADLHRMYADCENMLTVLNSISSPKGD